MLLNIRKSRLTLVVIKLPLDYHMIYDVYAFFVNDIIEMFWLYMLGEFMNMMEYD